MIKMVFRKYKTVIFLLPDEEAEKQDKPKTSYKRVGVNKYGMQKLKKVICICIGVYAALVIFGTLDPSNHFTPGRILSQSGICLSLIGLSAWRGGAFNDLHKERLK
jgi:hypothetical protein